MIPKPTDSDMEMDLEEQYAFLEKLEKEGHGVLTEKAVIRRLYEVEKQLEEDMESKLADWPEDNP